MTDSNQFHFTDKRSTQIVDAHKDNTAEKIIY